MCGPPPAVLGMRLLWQNLREPFLVLFFVFSLYELDPSSAGSRVLLFILLVFPKKCSFNH